MAKYIGALDQGTTSTRFLIFDRQGNTVAGAQKEHQQIYPRPGWVEHNAAEIWLRSQEVMAEATSRAGLAAEDVAAIGIANQRETTVLWNRATGQPVANALVWQDTRVAEDVAELARHGGQDRFRKKTGLPLSTYFSALKARWLLNNVPGLRPQAQGGDVLFGTVDAFLVWKLTGGPDRGVHVTDVTNASRTQLMNLETLSWDDELTRSFEIPAVMLPRIVPSSMVYGTVADGPLRDVPIAGILGDQQAALVGQTCFRPGEAKNTYGTGCFLLMNTGERPVYSQSGLLTTVAYNFERQRPVYALEGSVAITGALVQWLRDNLGLIASSSDIETLAQTVTDNGGVYFVPAFSGLYAPYWKDNARGVVAGLTRYANRGHLARAVLEATAFQTRDVVEAMELDCQITLPDLRVDGGMVVNEILMQAQADVLQKPVIRSRTAETTALGAAYAAGLGVGFFKSTEELRQYWSADRTWTPRLDASKSDELYRFWKKAVQRSYDWID
jgi:glycerol kinase